jgi:ubiquitin-protein ligase
MSNPIFKNIIAILEKKQNLNYQQLIDNKSYYTVKSNKIKLFIVSSVEENLIYELETNNNLSKWLIVKCDNNHHILGKILPQFNVLEINKNDLKKHISDLIELLEILKIKNYCFNCGIMLDLAGDKFMACDDKKCINMCSSYLLDNTISTEFQKYKNSPNITILEFIIQTAYWCIESSRKEIIYNPYPLLIEDIANNESSSMWVLLNNFISQYPYSKIIKILKDYDNDNDIYNKIGHIGYAFIKFTLKSNNTLIYKDTLINSKDVEGIISGLKTKNEQDCEKIVDIIGDNINNLIQFGVEHPQMIENKFKKAKETCYLYHGSRQENWYSIMRNGLKIASTDNKLLVNGAVYGAGIYLSDAVNFSLSYSNSENIIMGVCNVMENREKWKKADNIYVIQDENLVLLKYILIFPNTNKFNNFKYGLINILDKKFQSGIKEDKMIKQEQVSSLRNKRLMREYKVLYNQDAKERGFNFKLANENNLDVWKIYIQSSDFDGNPNIQNQMKEYKISEVEIEFRFNENYPVQPPFVRIVSPRFIYRTGHITLGGSICMELLTNQGWDMTTSISTVITYIKSAILDGDGQIDPSNYNKSYNMDEAIDSYQRMLKSHGWI